MIVNFGATQATFKPWRPEYGCVYRSSFAFDSETTPIDPAQPWLVPDLVLAAAFDGRAGYFLQRVHVPAFLAAHADVSLVMHHAGFDLAVVHKLAPSLDVYGWVDRNQVWDTQLQHRLFTLAAEGHTAGGLGESTLEHCVQQHLNVALPKDTLDLRGNPVRTSYSRWLDCEPRDIESVYLTYMAKDVVATWLLFVQLQALLQQRLAFCGDAFGFVSSDWLNEQISRWGPQTHHTQLRSAIVLEAASAAGLCVDTDRCRALTAELEVERDTALASLQTLGWAPGPGSNRTMQTILADIQVHHPDHAIPLTASGKYTTAAKELARLDLNEPFLAAHARYAHAKKTLDFLARMGRGVLHPRFDPLKMTGRTSSSGDLNSQNLPRDNRVRQCFVPSPGHVFIDADDKGVELATLAQACLRQFDWTSQMAEAINAGHDLHAIVAAQVTGKPLDKISKEERQQAKAANFGRPAGMGDEALQRYARDSYGVALTAEEVSALSAAWFDLFPEMRQYLDAGQSNAGEAVANLLGLTPRARAEAAGYVPAPFGDAHSSEDDSPDPILGWMLLKVAGQSNPITRSGRPYDTADLDFFWTKLQTLTDLVPVKYRDAIQQRRPSSELRWAILRAVTSRGVFTLTGRLRAKASYTESHNTIFQGLAADGAKLALWDLWRAGYRVVNFVHDEIVLEVPEQDDLSLHVSRVKQLMIEAMQLVVPDVHIDVEIAVATCWSKQARLEYDAVGHVVPWRPADSAERVCGDPQPEKLRPGGTAVGQPVHAA